MYKSWVASMDEGWTRLVFDNFQIPYTSISDADIKSGNLNYEAIILPSDTEREILQGFNKTRYPDEICRRNRRQGRGEFEKICRKWRNTDLF